MTFSSIAQEKSSHLRSLYNSVLGIRLEKPKDQSYTLTGYWRQIDQSRQRYSSRRLTHSFLSHTVSALDSGSIALCISSTFFETDNPFCYPNILPVHLPNTQNSHLNSRPLSLCWLLFLDPPQHPDHLAPSLLADKLPRIVVP